MSSVNYAAMSYQELRRYFLAHRDDNAAFQVYLARRQERSRPVTATVDDPNFGSKIQASIRQQIQSISVGMLTNNPNAWTDQSRSGEMQRSRHRWP